MPDFLQHQVLFQASLRLLPPTMRDDVSRQEDEGDKQAGEEDEEVGKRSQERGIASADMQFESDIPQ